MFDLLVRINREFGMAFAIVTHDQALAALAHRQLYMDEGLLVDARSTTPRTTTAD